MDTLDLPSGYKLEITKGSGPGGQHRNKVETCVKITYVPLGITETCQESRSKLQNFKLAKERIIAKVKKINDDKINEEKNNVRKDQINQQRRRTYNYKTNIVTDHITGKKANLTNVLNGDLDLLK